VLSKTLQCRKDTRKAVCNVKTRKKFKELLDDYWEKRGYWKLKEEALDRILWRTRFGSVCGPVVRQLYFPV
jgi:hypothetical protein